MTVNNDQVINWFTNRIGELTYSMEGSRNGSDGTADCSGSISQALIEASGVNNGLLSTISLDGYLAKLGYQKVYSGPTAGATNNQDGDIILMSITDDMAGSGGSGGHVGVIHQGGNFISCTATRWTDGATFVEGQAIQSAPWDQYKNVTRLKAHSEVWRNGQPEQRPSGRIAVDGYWGLDTWHAMQDAAGRSHDDIISGQNKKYQSRMAGITMPIDWSEKGSLTIAKWQRWLGIDPDGIIGKDFLGTMQTKLKSLGYYNGTIDQKFDRPSSTIKALQTMLNKGFKI